MAAGFAKSFHRARAGVPQCRALPGAGARPLAEGIGQLCGSPRVFIATVELPIPPLLALLARAHSMISIDTGPAHSAAAMGCPLVVLFAQRHARVLSMPMAGSAPVVTLGLESEADDRSTLTISVDAVLTAWRRMVLAPPPGA